MLRSHSILNPVPVSRDLERVVCDYCGNDRTRVLATLPPPAELTWPMHRLGAAVLELGDQAIQFCQCQECGLAYMNPRLTESAIARFYDTVYAAPGASELFEGDQLVSVTYHLDILARLLPTAQPSLLDIGCGAGQLLLAAQRRGWAVAGAELSGYAAEHASRALGLPIYHGDFRDMGLAPASQDAVTFIHVVEHLRAPIDFLRDAAALLKPGGVLLFDVPNITAWEYRTARMLRQLWRGFIIEHLYYFTPGFLRRLVADLDLDLIAISGRNPATRFPNPLRDWRTVVARGRPIGESAADQSLAAPPMPPARPVSLGRRVLRQANNYLLDTIASLSERRDGTAANMVYVWARRRM